MRSRLTVKDLLKRWWVALLLSLVVQFTRDGGPSWVIVVGTLVALMAYASVAHGQVRALWLEPKDSDRFRLSSLSPKDRSPLVAAYFLVGLKPTSEELQTTLKQIETDEKVLSIARKKRIEEYDRLNRDNETLRVLTTDKSDPLLPGDETPAGQALLESIREMEER